MVDFTPPDNSVSTPPIPMRAALWIGDDRETQAETVTRYAAENGFEIVATYHGRTPSVRDQLRADAEGDRFDAVIAMHGDSTPDSVNLGHLRDALTAVGVRLVLVSDQTRV